MKSRRRAIKKLVASFASGSDSPFVISDLMDLAEMAAAEARHRYLDAQFRGAWNAVKPSERTAALQALAAAFPKDFAAAMVRIEAPKPDAE